MTSTDELERLMAGAGIKAGTLFAEHGSILIDDRYLYDVGHGEAEQGGDLHEVASMLPIMAELFVAAVNALPELLALREENERLRNEFPTREKQAFVMGLNCAAKSVRETSGGSAVCEQTRLLIADSLDHAVETARAAINQEPKP